MSGYLPTIRFETEYEGDDVAIEMNALARNAFIKIMPMLSEARGKDSGQDKKMAVYGSACDVLNEHIITITGLKDKNGNAVNKETLLSAVYFIDLVTGAFQRLIAECSLGKLKSTDSEGKSPESTAALASIISH
jgi:hypothetical protein